MLVRVVFDYALIALIIVIVERNQGFLLYLLAIMMIGARQVGLGSVALHDGAHHLLFKARRTNDFFANAILFSLLAPLVGIRLKSYRAVHIAHHRTVNTSEDPDYPNFENWFSWSRKRMVFTYALLLTGIPFLMFAFRRFKSVSRPTQALELIGIAALIICLVLHIRIAELFALYWLAPLATWGFFINFVRSAAEHCPPGTLRDDAYVPAIFRTAEIVNSPFDSIFVATRGVNYHLTHHLFPSVPFYRLKTLQRELATVEEYQRYSNVTCGYHRYLVRFFTRNRHDMLV